MLFVCLQKTFPKLQLEINVLVIENGGNGMGTKVTHGHSLSPSLPPLPPPLPLSFPLHLPPSLALGAALLSASMALATCGVRMIDLPIASSVVYIYNAPNTQYLVIYSSGTTLI